MTELIPMTEVEKHITASHALADKHKELSAKRSELDDAIQTFVSARKRVNEISAEVDALQSKMMAIQIKIANPDFPFHKTN